MLVLSRKVLGIWEISLIDSGIKKIVNDTNILLVDWQVSDICNFNCLYCDDTSKSRKYGWPELNQNKIILRKLLELAGARKIKFSLIGGELTIWRDFIEFVKLVRDIIPNSYIELTTNGFMPRQFWINHGQLFDHIQFSLHINNEHYDIKRIIESVNSCSCKNIGIFLMLIPDHWHRAIEDYDYILNNLNVYCNLQVKSIDSRATPGPISLLYHYTTEQLAWIDKVNKESRSVLYKKFNMLDLYDISKQNNVFHNDGEASILNSQYLIFKNKNSFKGWSCSIPEEKITLRVNGDITHGSACNVGGILGNWRTGEFNINYSKKNIMCPYDMCTCANEIAITKEKI